MKKVEDSSALKLSAVGRAAYDSLKFKHAWHHHVQWNVTSGTVIGSLHQTPSAHVFTSTADPKQGHTDWFPQKMCDIMSKTTTWCDVMSLGPPDGIFIDKIKEALKNIAKTANLSEKPIIIRMMFGNIVGMPTNCNSLIKKLTADLPSDANIMLWVGAWRKGASWNHAKLIAVDGRYLHTGGHNLWDYHYLKNNPVHDLSVELEGRVAHDGHLFANEQWVHIERKQSGCVGQCAEKIPDGLPLVWHNRVIISEYPIGKATEFAPLYNPDIVPRYDAPIGSVPIISLGRQGALTIKNRPADDAFLAMIGAAKTIIRMSLQDLGPVCIPNTKISLPGLKWPKPILNALAKAIFVRGVDVEIVLSNPGSIPGGLGLTDACYGNGWTCVDVAAEIVKRIKKLFPNASDDKLRQLVRENLRVCFIRHAKKTTYQDKKNIGNHSKYFIIDDVASYVGSQNLYMCDLAEWGVLIDDEAETKKMIQDFWNPLWQASYTAEDCDVDEVMDGLDIDRDGENVNSFTADGRKKLEEAAKMQAMNGGGIDAELYSKEDDPASAAQTEQ
eukprot:CAMPEP_0176497338 /NCGR_PEP_ID=MMETSP0200_2-20121128/11669_1 /TAXON_ID=947934 /ORGANISM="Chaetoceros sp., Strain GSL56" /LENGTH=555 /DNA_ID=CAMNT_0017895341 /DNA_START=94 /DNA_END=1761 /DNA_ORIENTATION=+